MFGWDDFGEDGKIKGAAGGGGRIGEKMVGRKGGRENWSSQVFSL